MRNFKFMFIPSPLLLLLGFTKLFTQRSMHLGNHDDLLRALLPNPIDEDHVLISDPKQVEFTNP